MAGVGIVYLNPSLIVQGNLPLVPLPGTAGWDFVQAGDSYCPYTHRPRLWGVRAGYGNLDRVEELGEEEEDEE